MNDHPTDDIELVSAYLDGHVDADERARVESSATLRALVDDMAAVRAHLGSPFETPRLGDAVATALAHHGSPRAVVTNVGRRRLTGLVGAVAAGLLLVGVVTMSTGRDDADEAGVAVIADSSAVTDEQIATNDSATTDGEMTTRSSGSPKVTIDQIIGPATAVPVVSDTDALLDLVASDPVGPMPTTSGCELAPGETVLAEIIWISTPAVVVVDGARRVRVLDATCTTVVEVVAP